MRIFIAALILLFATPSYAETATHEDVVIHVDGMVCDFCAQSIWKVFEDYDAVTSVDVDLDTASVTVHLKSGQDLTDEELDKAITYAGYDLVDITRQAHGS